MAYLIYYNAHMESTIKCSLCGKGAEQRVPLVRISLRGNLAKVHQNCLDKITTREENSE